jgi:type I restriction enzyme S subunit
MEVKPGYKQTEVGVIPKDWEVCTIQQLIDRNAILGHLDGNHGALYPRSHEFKDFGVPYITANDFCGHKVSFTHCKYLSEERARRFRKGVAKNGDVLFAHNATVGPTAILWTNLDYVILSTTATYFRCNQEELINSFLLYGLQSPLFVRQYQGVMSQSTRNQVPITAQRKLSVVLPPTKAEQEAIAESLSDADALTESLAQLIAKKRHLKQGAMQELLTSTKRLPGFSGDWQTHAFGDMFDILRSASNSRSELTEDGEVGYIHYGDIHTHPSAFFDCSSDLRTFIEPSKICTTPPMVDGDLVMVDASEDTVAIGKAVEIRGLNGRKAVAGLHTILLRAKQGFLADGFKGYLQYFPDVRSALVRFATGVSVYGVAKSNVKTIQVAIPKPDEQTAIATILSDMDAEIAALETKLAKSRQIKQGMMQELLTGRIRLI